MSEQENKAEVKSKPVRKKKEAVEAASAHSAVALAEPQPATKRQVSLPAGHKYYGTGRRKEAVAKVWLVPGSGKIVVNRKSMAEYFVNRKILEYYITRPFTATQNIGKYDVFALVEGGGVPGQAGAVGLGIARALLEINPDLKVTLKRQGLLTRDPRTKERKKAGLKRARRAFQYTKR